MILGRLLVILAETVVLAWIVWRRPKRFKSDVARLLDEQRERQARVDARLAEKDARNFFCGVRGCRIRTPHSHVEALVKRLRQ